MGAELKLPAVGTSRCSAPPLTLALGPRESRLQASAQAIVVSMRANPEPRDLLILQETQSTVSRVTRTE
jgi:hypothetical protein